MLEDKYIVFRSSGIIVPTLENLSTREVGIRTYERPPETLEIEEAVLTKSERYDLRRDPRTRALAPSMPMKLIKPTEEEVVSSFLVGNNLGRSSSPCARLQLRR